MVRQLAQAVDPEGHLGRQVQQVLHLLRAGCLGKAAAVAAVVLLALVVLAVLEVAALVAVAVVLAVALTQQALVVSVVQAGHWYWSFDYGSLCRC